MENFFSVKNINVYYGDKKVLNNISFNLKHGEILGVGGESGSGKSTLIKACTGMLERNGIIEGGGIFLKGKNLLHMDSADLRKLRGPEISLIFQNPALYLSPVRTIGSQMKEILKEHGKYDRGHFKEEQKSLLKRAGLDDGEKILKSYPFQLSGGMNQKVGLAFALMLDPSLIFADEPTANLDTIMQKEAANELLTARKKLSASMVTVSHNLGFLSYVSDKIAIIYNGSMVEYGGKAQVLKNPKHPYTKALISSVIRVKESMPEEIENRNTAEESICSFYGKCVFACQKCLTQVIEKQYYDDGHYCYCNLRWEN